MGNVVNFRYDRKEAGDSHITLKEWLVNFYSRGDLEVLFASMDSAMKYIHNKGFCIRSFNPNDIEILNDSLSQIRFNSLMMMPHDFTKRKNIVREDIGKSSFIQIGIYAGCLDSLRPDFLKNNFNEFSTFLPEDYVPYYRGVVEREASVYLGDFLIEKRKRDLAALEKDVGVSSETVSYGKRLVKSSTTAADLIEYDSMNSKVNDSIYKQLSGMSDAAFISFLLAPTLVAIFGLIFAIIALLSR